jgi:hypothetical protein
MPLFNNMFKYVYNKINKNSIFLNIEIYNKYFIIYHMYIRYKVHNILYIYITKYYFTVGSLDKNVKHNIHP